MKAISEPVRAYHDILIQHPAFVVLKLGNGHTLRWQGMAEISLPRQQGARRLSANKGLQNRMTHRFPRQTV
jgi:hypothetical protein